MTSASKTGRALTAILLAGALAALAGCSSKAEVTTAVQGSAKAAKLTQCVRPTDFMRRNHMELIKHQRGITVHEGIRATKYSLAGCIDCHVQYDAQGRPVPVNAPGQFCDRCHERLAVELDCFDCHSPVPRGPQPLDIAGTARRVGRLGQLMASTVGAAQTLRAVGQEKGN
jgi:[DsrC]-trisulfide reductase subunit J